MTTQRCTYTDIQVALCELQLAGLIEFRNGEEFHLTEKGAGYGTALIDKLPVKDRLMLMMTKDELMDASVENVGEDAG
jgi:hypothetical protein